MLRALEHGRRCVLGVAIVAAGALTVQRASGAIHPSYGGLLHPKASVVVVPLFGGAYANTLTGNVIIPRGILGVPARGVPIELFLVFNSDRRHVASPFGRGWTFSYNLRYVDDAAGNIRIVWGDGRVDLFTASGGGFVSPAGTFSTLSRPSPGVLELRSTHGMVFRFADASSRKLTAVVDPNGNSLSLGHDAQGRLTTVTDAAGRQWQLEYGPTGLLATIRDPNVGTRAWKLGHDAMGHLTEIEDPLGGIEHLAYDADDLPITLTDRRGYPTTLIYTGAPAARVLATATKEGSTVALEYDGGFQATTITDPIGFPWIHLYLGGRIWRVRDPLGGEATFGFDLNDLLAEYQDRRGHSSKFTYDAKGNLTKLEAPLAGATVANAAIAYHPTCNRPASVGDPRGYTWTYTWDAACNLVRVDDPPAIGTHATTAYDAMGQPASATDRSARTTTFGWSAHGDLASVTDPLGGATTFEHDGAGMLTKVTDPLGHDHRFEYDVLGRLTSDIDAYGHPATYEYDEDGRLVAFTDREANQTGWIYDSLGRLFRIRNALGSYDFRVYDPAGRLVSYDDRMDNTWRWTYDALGRVTEATDPVGRVWTATYDADDNPASVTDGKGQTTTFTYDDGDRLIQRDFADGSRTAYTYDAGSNLLTAVDRVSPGGAVTSNLGFVYDAANRTTHWIDNLIGKSISRTWDGDGRQLSQVDLVGNVATYQYDAAGRNSRISGFGGAAVYTRDAAGRIVLDQRDSGISAAYTWDDAGRLASNTIRGPASPVPSLLPSGPVIESFTNTVDLNGDVVGVLRETGEYVAFTRDPQRRVTQEQGTLGGTYTLSIQHDDNGNRTSLALAKAAFNQIIQFTFDDSSRATTFSNKINGSGPFATYTLDGNGSRTLASYVGGGSTAINYNARGQATSIAETPGDTNTFAYDALDRLSSRSSGPFTTRYVYGPGPVGATNAGGTPQANSTSAPLFSPPAPAGTRPFQCFVNGGVPPTTRAEELSELVGEITLQCAGGQQVSSGAPPLVRLSNIRNLGAPGRVRMPSLQLVRIDVLGISHDTFREGNVLPAGSFAASSTTGFVTRYRDLYANSYGARGGVGNLGVGESFLGLGDEDHPDLNLFTTGSITFDKVAAQPLNGGTRPPVGTSTVSGSYAPLSVARTSFGAAPIPRFVDSATADNQFQIDVCATSILWSFIPGDTGFDTGIACANGSSDAFGTATQSGVYAVNSLGVVGGAALPSSGSWPTFQSCSLAQCGPRYANRFAFTSDVGARDYAMGYLALVLDGLDSRTSLPEETGR